MKGRGTKNHEMGGEGGEILTENFQGENGHNLQESGEWGKKTLKQGGQGKALKGGASHQENKNRQF